MRFDGPRSWVFAYSTNIRGIGYGSAWTLDSSAGGWLDARCARQSEALRRVGRSRNDRLDPVRPEAADPTGPAMGVDRGPIRVRRRSSARPRIAFAARQPGDRGGDGGGHRHGPFEPRFLDRQRRLRVQPLPRRGCRGVGADRPRPILAGWRGRHPSARTAHVVSWDNRADRRRGGNARDPQPSAPNRDQAPGDLTLDRHQALPLEVRQVVTYLGVGQQEQDGLHLPPTIVSDSLEPDGRFLRFVVERHQFFDVSGDASQADEGGIGRRRNGAASLHGSIVSTVSTMRACGLRMTLWPSPLQTRRILARSSWACSTVSNSRSIKK